MLILACAEAVERLLICRFLHETSIELPDELLMASADPDAFDARLVEA